MMTWRNQIDPTSSPFHFRRIMIWGSTSPTSSSVSTVVPPDGDEREMEEGAEIQCQSPARPILPVRVRGVSKNGKKLGRPFKRHPLDKSSTSKPKVKVTISRSRPSTGLGRTLRSTPEILKALNLMAVRSPKTIVPRVVVSKIASVSPSLTIMKIDDPAPVQVSKSIRGRSKGKRKALFGKEALAEPGKISGSSLDSSLNKVTCPSPHVPWKENAGGTETPKRRILSPDITSLPIRIPATPSPSVLPIRKCSTSLVKLERRKGNTKRKEKMQCVKSKSNLLEDSEPKNRNQRWTVCSTENVEKAIDFVSKRSQRGEVLDLRRHSSDTVQAVEKASLHVVRSKVSSVSPKVDLRKKKRKPELYNDEELAHDVTRRNVEPTKTDGMEGPSLIPGPNIISPSSPCKDSFKSLSVEFSANKVENWLEKIPQCAVRSNQNNTGASSSKRTSAESALNRSRSMVPVIQRLDVSEYAKKYTPKGRSKYRLPVPTVKVLGGKSIFLQDGKEVVVDADPKFRAEGLDYDPDVPWICTFCSLGPHARVPMPHDRGWGWLHAMGDLFGPYYSNLPSPSRRETWMHGDCALWAGRLTLVLTELKNLEDTLKDANNQICTICGKNGATVSCFQRKCELSVHFPCAKSGNWKLDVSTLLACCPKHR